MLASEYMEVQLHLWKVQTYCMCAGGVLPILEVIL